MNNEVRNKFSSKGHIILTCLLSSFLYILFSGIVYSQQSAHFTSLNQSNGLISGDVMCFQQDENGFMWIGTKYGLNVYDGANFNVYRLKEDKLLNSDISALQNANKTKIWIGTLGDGLYVMDIVNKKIKNIALNHNNDSTHNVNCLQSWKNSIWVGTDIGLFKITDTKTEFINLNRNIKDITELALHSNQLAIGTRSDGLILLDNDGKITFFDFIDPQINALESLNKTTLLIGTQTEGLHSLNTQNSVYKRIFFQNKNTVNPQVINEILIDRKKNIWIGTDGDGLIHLKQENGNLEYLERYTYDGKKRNSIASNAVFSLYEDLDGNLWIGTIWKGLSVLNHIPSNYDFYYSDFTGDEPYPVLSIYKENNELWFGTDGRGLNIIDEKTRLVKKYNSVTKPYLSSDYIQTIFKDSKGIYWIGTFSSGLIKFDRKNETVKEFRHNKENKSTISYNDIRTILEDKNNNLWVATWGGGLNRFNRNSETFSRFNLLENNTTLIDNITSICFTQNSQGIWVGTFGKGLYYFDINTETFTSISLHGLQSLKILKVYLDKNGKLWIGTWGEGIKIYNTISKKEEQLSGLSQISSSRVTSIEEDNFGNLFFSTKNGLYKFILTSNTLIKYGGFDLITNKEFHINSSFKDSEGKIYFGGIEGVIAIQPAPESITDSLAPPVLTNMQIYNEESMTDLLEEIFNNKKIKLAYNQNYFTFSFSTPKYPVSNINYSYKLEDFNNDWITTSGDEANFTNIPPGKYVFSVRSTINNINWSTPAKIYIKISQPLWKRWYAYLIYVSVFVLLLFLFQKYAREWEALKSNLRFETLARDKENELHNIKQRFFTNISHEIRTPVTLILGAVNRLIEGGSLNKSNQKEIDVLHNNSRHLLHLIYELLDFRRLETDGIKLRVAEGNFVKFAREIYLSFQTKAYSNNIDYKFVSAGDEIKLWYDRDQMEKVLYNLISNAFKFTPSGGTITIDIDEDNQNCFIKVIDSGIGIDEKQLADIFKRFYQSENTIEIRKSGFGLGLSIAKEIVELHGGEIDAANNIGTGICISVKLPKGNFHFSENQKLKDFKSSEDIENYIALEKTEKENIDFKPLGELSLLIVEDNDQLREYLNDMFSFELTVYAAANGQDGLEIARENIPDIIISDVMMPVLDGVSMTKELKTDKRTSHIPIILLTARTNLIYKKEGYDVGADDYITKPFNESLLKTRVYNILKSRIQLREKILGEYIVKPREELNISTPDQQFLSDLTRVIENNIHENEINAKLISGELCMSHSVVYKKIKALTGLSLIEFVRDFKLKRAAVLLSKYQLNVTDVCYKVGFSDRRYFSKLFKQKYGVTPSEYVKSNL